MSDDAGVLQRGTGRRASRKGISREGRAMHRTTKAFCRDGMRRGVSDGSVWGGGRGAEAEAVAAAEAEAEAVAVAVADADAVAEAEAVAVAEAAATAEAVAGNTGSTKIDLGKSIGPDVFLAGT